jgi:hypothetical protein
MHVYLSRKPERLKKRAARYPVRESVYDRRDLR